MSLKAFHLFFMTCSILLCLGIGVLCLRNYFLHRTADQLGLSMMAFAASVILVAYGRLFLKKFKDLRLL
jgi:hypothetical protein